MHVRFLLGPAGSGKTYRCLKEASEQLLAAPEGPPLVLIAPKQATYQVERQLLAGSSLPGYTRLQIFSFERLAHFVFEQLGQSPPELLGEEGRVMVLRSLLARKRKDLKLFRASARLSGFARQLSLIISEFQRNRMDPSLLRELATRAERTPALALKLQDLAALMGEYLAWLNDHGLQDTECLLSAATQSLLACENRPPNLQPQGVWIDGFAEFSDPELEFIAALLPGCQNLTLALCLDASFRSAFSWLSNWTMSGKTLEHCRKRLAMIAGAEISVEQLARTPQHSRFSLNPVLRHLEEHWSWPQPFGGSFSCSGSNSFSSSSPSQVLRVVACADPQAEAVFAAREILDFARRGGRYREAAVLVRRLEGYHQVLQRVFSRYGIPFFLDRRESVAHHPLAELTRSALRTVAMGWQHEDWFAALKTGLVPVPDEEIDCLENEALARGWRGTAWHQPLQLRESSRTGEDQKRLQAMESRLEGLRQKIIAPFERLALALKLANHKPTGRQLATALRELWAALHVQEQLQASASRTGSASAVGTVDETVWNEINTWLENIELAFAGEALPLRDWLPILEAGLGSLTIGLIPPALDQVMIGAIDRSRNPELKLALVLGLNETVFPCAPESNLLLTENDRAELEKLDRRFSPGALQQLGREGYFAYIACTRARERLILTYALQDAEGSLLNPSPFLSKIRQLFPSLPVERGRQPETVSDCEREHELLDLLLQGDESEPLVPAGFLENFPSLAGRLKSLRQFQGPAAPQCLTPQLAAQLYGPKLQTSVSRIEQFAACPFKFFIHSGLRAEERKRFELDVKEQGTFQHDVLALFHEQLCGEGKRWRDITPEEARERVGAIAAKLLASYREGLMQVSEQTRFLGRILTESLQDFAETLVAWMREQYRFDPAQVELPFGEDENSPAWTLALGERHQLLLRGRIDRIDLFRKPGLNEALCVVLDYKSSQKQLDPVLIANGLQLQLLAYLNVLRHWPEPESVFGAVRLVPGGVFYVSLRGKYGWGKNRSETLEDREQDRKLAYRHTGRFDLEVLRQLDGRLDARQGDQFNYRLNLDGSMHKGCRESLASADFVSLLDSVEGNLIRMGRQIYGGAAHIDPYRKGTVTACDQCEYQWICRIDPWTHRFRRLSGRAPDAPIA